LHLIKAVEGRLILAPDSIKPALGGSRSGDTTMPVRYPSSSMGDMTRFGAARAAAEAEFGIARVRRAKVALIERMLAFGQLEQPQLFESVRQITAFFNAWDRGELKLPALVDAAGTMPSPEADRLAEAVRRALPELLKLDRYERRAAALGHRCLRAMKNRITGASLLLV
jgi:hypothetical protein